MESIIKEYEKQLPRKVLDEAITELKKRNFSKDKFKKVLEHIKKEYDTARITPGEPIGIITAESFGEPGTQMTLNVFHFAGVAEVSVTQGLPRLIEILDARKEISTPSMEIYIKKEYNKNIKDVKRIAASIKETRFNELILEFTINLSKLQVEATLNQQRLKDLKIGPEEIGKVLRDSIKNVSISTSPNKITIKSKATENELMETYKLKEKLKDTFIKGVKKISQVLSIKNGNEFVIITAGSNLKDVLQIKEIDGDRTTTNDLFEVLSVLGIEATRRTIINETKKVIEDQGLDVDIRHIMLISDVMTTSGKVKGITRSGITGEKKSVLARASFETPLKHVINASLLGEEDYLYSVIENVMLNQPVPLGTSLPGLVARMKKGKQENEHKKTKRSTK